MKRAALVRKTREAEDLFPLGTGLEDYAVLKERVGKVFVEGRRGAKLASPTSLL